MRRHCSLQCLGSLTTGNLLLLQPTNTTECPLGTGHQPEYVVTEQWVPGRRPSPVRAAEGGHTRHGFLSLFLRFLAARCTAAQVWDPHPPTPSMQRGTSFLKGSALAPQTKHSLLSVRLRSNTIISYWKQGLISKGGCGQWV